MAKEMRVQGSRVPANYAEPRAEKMAGQNLPSGIFSGFRVEALV